MKKTSKAILVVLCALMLVIGSVMGTMAYLTYQTKTVKNTFTVGNVNLGGTEIQNPANPSETIIQEGLDEALVNAYGEKLNVAGEVAESGDTLAARVLENEYKLIPGHSYVKDPTIHVGADSEACWLFVEVANGIEGIEAGTTIAEQMAANGGKHMSGNVYAYKEVVETNDTGKDVIVFSGFEIRDDVTVADLQNYKSANVTVVAYAVQAEGFNTAAAAWTETFGKTTTP